MEDNKLTTKDQTVENADDQMIENANDKTTESIDDRIAKLDEAIARLSEKLEKKPEPQTSDTNSVYDKFKVKILITMVTTFIMILSLAVCTYAYFVSTVSSEGNRIVTGKSAVTLHDYTDPLYPSAPNGAISIMPGYSVGKSVYAENNGAYSVYIRAKIEDVITLNVRYADHEDEIDMSLVTYSIDTENWTERDGYYYYNTPIKAGEATTSLFASVDFSTAMGNIYKDSTIKVKILLEAVQSSGNGDTVFDAVGWASAEEGGTR